jgi:pimeloyl-ACP methyl ester carboxylesterase
MLIPTSRTSSIAVICVGLALLATSCSKVNRSTQQNNVRSAGTVTLKQDCTAQLCAGQRDGAAIQIKVPARKSWNGTLIIWSHGYRNAGPIPVDPTSPTSEIEQPDTSAEAAPSEDIANDLVGQGYALAGSAFKTNGWDVQDGVSADQDLYKLFSDTFGKPRRVYIWGASLGGLITETLAETKPDWVSGVAPLCGVLGGTNLNLDLALDVAYAVKTLIYPPLQLTGFTSQEDAVAQWRAASRAVVAKATNGGAAGIADLLVIADLAGAASKTDKFDGHDTTSIGQAYAQGIITALGYGTWGRYDIEQRVGGNPSQNTGVNYSARLSDAERTAVDTIAPGQLDRILATLNAGTRVSADQAARAEADQLGNPTGDIQRPTITLHTENDPLVLVQNEHVFAERVSARPNATGQLVQLFTGPPTRYSTAPYGAGHCNFTSTELLGVVTLLDNWVRYGQYAGPGAVAKVLDYSVNDADTSAKSTPAKQENGTAETGYDPAFVPEPWPAATTP